MIYRSGATFIEIIRSFMIENQINIDIKFNSNFNKISYQTKTPFTYSKLSELSKSHPVEKIGALNFDNYLLNLPKENQRILSKSGNLNVAAKKLYKALNELDSLNLNIIIVETLPETGLGRVINNRLKRLVND
jgi:L-threonylcarbamoyladenylate synthase